MDAQQTTPPEERDPLKQLDPNDWSVNDFLSLAFDYVELNIDGCDPSDVGAKFEFASMVAARRALMQHMVASGFEFSQAAWNDQAAMETRVEAIGTAALLADFEASSN
jgi:hypothetical protein